MGKLTAGVNPMRIWNSAYDTSVPEELPLPNENVKATKNPEQEITIITSKAIMSSAIILCFVSIPPSFSGPEDNYRNAMIS